MGKFDYNHVVLGAGSAGLVSAYLSATLQNKVALIEKSKMGGECLNTGCVPSKALIRVCKLFADMKRANQFGIQKITPEFEFSKVMSHVRSVITSIEPHDSKERYESLGVECIEGQGKIVSPHEVRVGNRTLTTRAIILATGARPFIPPIPGIELVSPKTSDTIWDLPELPKRLVILGGGPIGVELSQCFARLGSNVTLIEKSDRLLAKEDPDVSDFIHTLLKKEGVTIHLSAMAKLFSKDQTSKKLILDSGIEIPFEEALVATGRKAAVDGFGLNELGVALTPSGLIRVDDFLETSVRSIFACGDVASSMPLTNMAAHMAFYCVFNSQFRWLKRKIDSRPLPWCTFSDPEIARVGLNEAEARKHGVPYDLTHYPMSELDRAIIEGSTQGFVKVLTAKKSGKILGATIIGDHAGELITEFALSIKHGFGLKSILGTPHVYPTLSEANKYVAGAWSKARVKPWQRGILQKISRFQRG